MPDTTFVVQIPQPDGTIRLIRSPHIFPPNRTAYDTTASATSAQCFPSVSKASGRANSLGFGRFIVLPLQQAVDAIHPLR